MQISRLNTQLNYYLVSLSLQHNNKQSRIIHNKHKINNMAKVAKLVEFSLLVRVIVDENATDDEIIKKAYPKVQDKIDSRELGDNMVSCKDDEECPFGTFDEDK